MPIMLLFIHCLLHIFCYVACYNIDTKHPIVYSLPKTGNRANYFGYTVAIRPRAEQYLNWAWVLQIGAPRSNVSLPGNPVEPGAVYRCRVDGECSLARLDTTGNVMVTVNRKIGGNKPKFVKALASERKDNGWVGVAMDIEETPQGEITVVCGHRITFQAVSKPMGINDESYLTIGGCYLQLLHRSYNTTRLLLPLKDEKRTYHNVSVGRVDFDWGQGLAGMAAHFTQSSLIVGAPHVYYMTGTVLSYSRNGTQLRVVDMTSTPYFFGDYFAYNGYSMESGKFFGGGVEWNVLSAPRSTNLHGRVFAFQFVQRGIHTTLLIHPSVLRGETYGEYFGASLSVGDINGDGFDDLVVGAPMYSQRFIDQGRVYVYLGNRRVDLGFEAPHQGAVLNGLVANGRFGSCVSVAGDLDQDGFRDVIVGAPYEEGGGAIYLYRGSARGLQPQVAQVIRAKELSPLLKGFGISISAAVGVDRNSYPDVLIGAYLSDQAVLLRTRPVVKLLPQIQTLILERKQTKFNISVCIPYIAKTPPKSCNVNVNVVLDQKLKRARFSNGSRTWTMKNLSTSHSSPLCLNIPATVDSEAVNGSFNHPIEVSVAATLVEDESKKEAQVVWEKKVSVPPLLAISDIASTGRSVADFPFAGDCGLDKICHSRLNVDCQFSHSKSRSSIFTVGSDRKLGFDVTVRNEGEPAHITTLEFVGTGISVSDVVTSASGFPCLVNDAANLVCDLETIDDHAEKSLSFHLATDSWATSASENAYLFLNANTSSNLTNPLDGSCRLSLDLLSDADIDLDASSSVPKIYLSKLSHHNLNFSHYFEVYKKGDSPVSVVHLHISIPISYESLTFAEYYKETPALTVDSEVNRVDIEREEETISTRTGWEEEEDEVLDVSKDFEGERILFVNCSVENVECLTLTFVSSQKNLAYDIPLLLNISALGKLLDGIDVIVFATNATAVAEHVFGGGTSVREAVAQTAIVVKVPLAAGLDLKILIFSIGAGVLLLAIIIPLLARKGFFRRKRKEEMEALKNQDFIAQRFSMYGNANPSLDSPDFSVNTLRRPSDSVLRD